MTTRMNTQRSLELKLDGFSLYLFKFINFKH